jgi:hypothetical protein
LLARAVKEDREKIWQTARAVNQVSARTLSLEMIKPVKNVNLCRMSSLKNGIEQSIRHVALLQAIGHKPASRGCHSLHALAHALFVVNGKDEDSKGFKPAAMQPRKCDSAGEVTRNTQN